MSFVIPAPEGFRLIEAFKPGKANVDKTVTFWKTTVIAFRIGEPKDDVIPITALGDAGEKPWALIHPDGTCTQGSDGFASVTEWKKDCGF